MLNVNRWIIYNALKSCREERGNRLLRQPYLNFVQSKVSIKIIEDMNPLEVKEGLLEFLTTVACIPKNEPIEVAEKIEDKK